MAATTIAAQPIEKNDRAVTILKWLLYILAGLMLVFGLFTGIGFIGFAGNMSGYMFLIQAFTAPPVADLLAQGIRQIAMSVGIGVILLSLVMSVLLFTAGKLLGRTHDLARRVQQLEQMVAHGV